MLAAMAQHLIDYMISTLKHRLVFLPVLLLSLQFSSAQIYSGAYNFAFDQGSFPVYDLTGTYEMNQELQGPGGATVPLAFTIPTVIHDNSGKLRGSGLLMLNIGEDYVAANYTVSGTVSGGGANTRAVFTVRLTGQDVIAGRARRFSGSVSYNLLVDAGSLTLEGTSKGSITVQGVGTSKVISDSLISPNLPNRVDGAWRVEMNLLALKKLGGSATIIVNSFMAPDGSTWPADGRVIPTNVSGSYVARTDLARTQLTGINEGRGNSLLMIFSPGTDTAQLSGRILGQTIRY